MMLLKYISDRMEALGIEYEFMEWTHSTIPDPYFVGEYAELESQSREESGYQETTFLLTGTGRTWIDLERAKLKIENNISETAVLDNGSGIAVFYAGSLVIPTGDAELKRIQINLRIEEWKVK